MITPAKLYAATGEGLQILELHYPRAAEYAAKNISFRVNSADKNPSAHIRRFKASDGSFVYKLTDFGDDGRAKDPIQVHMDATGLSFREAVADLSARFNILDELNRAINRPDVRKQPAKEDQEDGKTYWDIDQNFTQTECAVMGPRVTPEHLKSLNWYRVNYLVTVKNREATYKYSTESYPIFMRECWFTDAAGKRDRFFKIYEPCNVDKQWRFQYQPKGKKPQYYTNGLSELMSAHKEVNDRAEKEFFLDPANEGKPYKPTKLPEAIICSGERDALCVRSLGYHPIWFNSETYRISDAEMKEISKYAETIYNIPDIDETGKLKGRELALRFIDVHTIWLPEKLSKYRDNRGKPRKDFRDWMEIWKDKQDFRNLMTLAAPARFWRTSYEGKDNPRLKYTIDIVCLFEFLRLNGFYILKDNEGSEIKYIRVVGSVVKMVTIPEIKAFVKNWCIETAQPRDLRSTVIKSKDFAPAIMEILESMDPDFTNYTEKTQTFYFPNFSIEVSGSGFEKRENKYDSAGRYIWDKDIIPHNIQILPDMFEITRDGDRYDSAAFDIKVNKHASKYFKYLINSSRLFWRKELETALEDVDPDEAAKYREEHKFDIAGPNLTEEEIQEQKQCLINKIFTIGYTLHRYKSSSRAWSPFAMDNVVGEDDQCNGGSGKSFMFRALSHFAKWSTLSGRNPKLLENNFVFENINKHLGFVVVDDCDEYLPFKQFYDIITSDMTINPKHSSSFQLPFQDSPKFVFTTNYVPKEFNPSTVRRMLFCVFSDYYHTQTPENDYRENRTIATDFDKNIMEVGSSYSESEWEADINFVLQCVRFYLSIAHLPIKIEPKMDNIIFRKHLREMSPNFKDWAEGYFAPDSDNLDTEIVREKAFEDYKKFSGVNKITMQKFSTSLRSFCITCDWIDCLNPEGLCNSGTRILRRIEDPATQKKVQKEVIYVQSKRAASGEAEPRVDPFAGSPDDSNALPF